MLNPHLGGWNNWQHIQLWNYVRVLRVSYVLYIYINVYNLVSLNHGGVYLSIIVYLFIYIYIYQIYIYIYIYIILWISFAASQWRLPSN